jgi:hypothetical protein
MLTLKPLLSFHWKTNPHLADGKFLDIRCRADEMCALGGLLLLI